MALKKRGLGRTLETLLAGSAPSTENSETTEPVDFNENIEFVRMPVDQLKPGQYQPRRDFDQDALQTLSESIKSQGILQPLVVRQLASGRYEIIAGERRFRAAQLAGLTEVPVIIKSLTDEEALAIALVENIQREDLNPLEEALALQRLANEFGLTHQETADAVGRSRSSVTNLLRLLTLNSDVKTLLEHGDIEVGHAKALLSLEGSKQSMAARMVVAKNLTVRETEGLVKNLLEDTPKKPKDKQIIDPDIRHLEQKLSAQLAAQVKIQSNAKGKGKLVISYSSLDELDGILSRIK